MLHERSGKQDRLPKRNLDEGSFIAILQEVKPTLASLLRDEFGGRGIFLYSMDFRPPGKYDSGARELGVAIIASDDIEVRDSGVFPRTLMPDRTLGQIYMWRDRTCACSVFIPSRVATM